MADISFRGMVGHITDLALNIDNLQQLCDVKAGVRSHIDKCIAALNKTVDWLGEIPVGLTDVPLSEFLVILAEVELSAITPTGEICNVQTFSFVHVNHPRHRRRFQWRTSSDNKHNRMQQRPLHIQL